MGFVPTNLNQLTVSVTNAQAETGGPFLGSVPTQPLGWLAYQLSGDTAAGTFAVSTTGDATTVTMP
jgi:hypothetical protein